MLRHLWYITTAFRYCNSISNFSIIFFGMRLFYNHRKHYFVPESFNFVPFLYEFGANLKKYLNTSSDLSSLKFLSMQFLPEFTCNTEI